MRTRPGFTLLEVVVVLLIFAAATALTVPALRGPERADDMTRAAQQLEELFGFARDSARHAGVPVTLSFDSASSTAWLLSGAATAMTQAPADAGVQLDLPEGVRVQLSSARATFSFSPSGAVFGDSLLLLHGTRSVLLTVDPWTGDVIAH